MLLFNFLRDIRNTLPRLISVIAVTALGVTIFLGLRGIGANLQYAIDAYLSKAAVSDLWITADDADVRDVRALRALGSVADVSPRVSLSAKWSVDEDVRLTLHTFAGGIAQCVPYIESGRPPENPRECMLSASFAKARGLRLGERLALEYEDRQLKYVITGLIISPEYVYNVSGAEIAPNPAKNGYLFVPESAVSTIYGEYAYNEILVKAKEGASIDALAAGVKSVLGERCLAVLEFEDNGRAHSIYDEKDSIESMAATFTALCFLTAALIMFTTMQRIVENSRPMIGTLKALGYSNGRIMFYFLGYALLVAALGSLLGILPGQAFTDFFMADIMAAYELPPLNFYMDWTELGVAAALSAASCLGTVLITLLRELRVCPAQCMRPKPPEKSRRNIIERSPLWLLLGFSAKTVVRNIFRNRMRALMCVVGVSLCMALVVTGLGASDTFVTFQDDLFAKLYRYDLQVALGGTVSEREERHIARMEGVKRLEAEMALPVEAFAVNSRRDTQIHVLEDEMALMVIDQEAGASMTMPSKGVFVAKQLFNDMGLSLGEALTLRLIGARETHTLPVLGVAPNVSGVYIGRALWRELGEGYRPSLLYLSANNPGTLKRALEEYDFVQSVMLKQELVAAMEEQLASNNIISVMMIAAGGVLAFAVLYSLGVMNFYDRIRDLATLSVLGFYPKEIRQLILSENMIFTIFGIGFGALLGLPLLENILGGEAGDTLSFVPVVLPLSYAISAALTLVFSLLVNLALGRKTKKIDMLGALKSVE